MDEKNFDFAVHLLKVIDKNNFWDSIDAVMKWMYKYHPKDMKSAEAEAAQARKMAYDKFGRAKDDSGKVSNDMRQLVMVPQMFLDVINRFYGGVLGDNTEKTKFYREYARRYPQFKKTEKI